MECFDFAFLIQTALNSDLKSGGTVKRMAGSTSGRRFNLTFRRESKILDSWQDKDFKVKYLILF